MDQIRQTNAGIIYRLIDQAGPVSRIDLSRLCQLAPASITKLAREMLQAQLVKETEIPGSGSRGRPAIGLEVATCRWHYLAVRIARGALCLAVYNMACQKQETASYPLAAEGGQPLAQRILQAIEHFCRQCQSRQLIAISVTLPGVVDSESGIVRRMAFYPAHDMPLGGLLARQTGLAVFIQHDISAWTMTEMLLGASRGARDVVQMVIDDHVGASVVSEGRLLHAGSSSLVEIGHIPMLAEGQMRADEQRQPEGRLCHCGHRGCLESLISTDNVLARWRQLLARHPSRLQHQPVSVENLCDAALQGNELAGQLIDEVARHAGRALSLLVNIFNPQKILLGSPFNRAAPLLFPAITAVIRQQSLPAYSQHITVESTHFSCLDTMAGTARVKDALYDGSLLMRLLHISRAD